MLALWVAMLSVGTVEVRLEDARGVSSADVETIVKGLKKAIAKRTGDDARVAGKSPCGRGPACIGRLTKEGGASDVVFVRLIGVPTRIRMIADRFGASSERSEVDLPRMKGAWTSVLGSMAEALFPVVRPPPPPDITIKPPPPPITGPTPPPAETNYGPWILMGAGAVVLAVGVGFGASSRGARSAASNEPHTPEELENLEDRAVGHGIAANVLFGLGGAGLVGGLVWWLVD